MFSPYYAWSRRRGGGNPLHHCALNVALYGRGKRWSMTERSEAAVRRAPSSLQIGPSAMTWDGSVLTIAIDEIAVPLPRRIRGAVRLYPAALESRTLMLDTAGRHRWQPIAPCARAEVALTIPDLSWSGPAYFDTNNGDRPLEADFLQWNWSRAPLRGGSAILYEVVRRDGPLTLAMRYDAAGGVEDFVASPPVELPKTRWRVPRQISAGSPAVLKTLEDTPFYARSVIAAELLGHPTAAMHESLDMGRFTAPLVQAMLPFRMPRRR